MPSPSHILIHLCSKGFLPQAFGLFHKEIYSEPTLFAHLLQGSKSLSLGKQLHSIIITSGSYIRHLHPNHLLNMYSKYGDLDSATALFDVMPRKNTMSSNIMIASLVKIGDLESAKVLFDEMPVRNLGTWNAMVMGFIQFGFDEEGLDLFLQMHGVGFSPDDFTLSSVLRGCAGLRMVRLGEQIHSYAVKSGFCFSLIVGSSLSHMYMKCGKRSEGEKVFEELPVRNVVAFNAVIAGKARGGCIEGVLDLFKLMKMEGRTPDKTTFVSVLSICSDQAGLGQGQQVHADVIKCGAGGSVSVGTTLVSMYLRCGCLEDSVNVFKEFEDDDVALWSSLIEAFGMEKKGIESRDVTFLNLLNECSHSRLRERGIEFFNQMVEKYILKPC